MQPSEQALLQALDLQGHERWSRRPRCPVGKWGAAALIQSYNRQDMKDGEGMCSKAASVFYHKWDQDMGASMDSRNGQG
jgi:hypothetical protein